MPEIPRDIIRCPIHHMPDCSPLLNGCSIPSRLAAAYERGAADVQVIERERDRLREWKTEATSLFDGMQDLGRALGLPLGVLVTGPVAIEAANTLREERDAALADRTTHRAELAAARDRASQPETKENEQ